MVTAPGRTTPRHLVVDAPDDATSGDLHDVLGLPLPPESESPLLHGYDVSRTLGDAPRGPVRVVVVSGPDAGASTGLTPGRWVTVGRARSCDLTVDDPALSREHVRIRQTRDGVVVEDLGSTNGFRWESPVATDDAVPRDGTGWFPGATLEVGSSRLALVLDPPAPVTGRAGAGRLRVTPWPRPEVRGQSLRLTSPAAPERRAVRAPSTWSWALPLVAAMVIAALLRMPMVLMFGLMAPAMVLGHHLGERRAARRDHEQALDEHAAQATRLEVQAQEGVAAELSMLRSRHPGLLGVASALLPQPTTSLWSQDGEPLTVVLGEGRCPSEVLMDDIAFQHRSAPVVLDLSEPVTVVGAPALRDAAVRSWLLQLASAHPPSRVTLVVNDTEHPGDEWDLLAWLPHTRPRAAAAAPTALRWGRDLIMVDDIADAPAGIAQVVLHSSLHGVVRRPGCPDRTFSPTLLGLPLARHLARALAPLVEEGAAGAPRPVTLGDLLPWPSDEDAVVRLWSGPGADLRAPIGTDPSGVPVMVDLARDGPHALVAGTTGSGKSELLRTLVTALALRNPPSRLGLLLIDYKGGSSLAECAELPHSTGLVTDLDLHLAGRVLVSLRSELRRRESVLAAAGVRDVRDYDGPDLARLVVVIDEFRVLAEELPDFLGGLVRLAAVGRSLGVHLVLATQRPAGVVSPDLRANVNLRIALRLRDAADSLDVLEVADAAHLPEGCPGRGLLRTGSGLPRSVQVAPAAPAAVGDRRRTWSVQEVKGVWRGSALLHGSADPGVGSDLGDLPSLLTRVARAAEGRTAPVWLPPLPDRIDSGTPGNGWAVADLPDRQRQEPLRWQGDRHLALGGAARSGRSTAIHALLADTGPVWLYVVDPARGLETTAVRQHPGLRAWVGPHDPAHCLRVLEVICEVIDRRLAEDTGVGAPPVVLAVDGWDRFLDAYGDVGRGRGRELALRILRDGPSAGVVAIVSGDRSVLVGAVASEAAEAWALPMHDPGDYLAVGLRPNQVPAHQPAGRAVRTRDGVVAQVVLPGTATALAAPDGVPPPEVVSLPVLPERTDAWAVGGDKADPVPVPATSFLVLGPPGSGVSTALAAISTRVGGAQLHLDASSLNDDSGNDDPRNDGSTLAGALSGFDGTVCVDDVHLLAGSRVEDLVLEWAGRTGGRLLVGGELEACSSLFRGLVNRVGRHRAGVVLQPSLPTHGSLFGLRLPVGDRLVPGRGVLVQGGRPIRIQVSACRPGRAEAATRPG